MLPGLTSKSPYLRGHDMRCMHLVASWLKGEPRTPMSLADFERLKGVLPGTSPELILLDIADYRAAIAAVRTIAMQSGETYDLHDLVTAACLCRGTPRYRKDQGHPFTMRTASAPDVWLPKALVLKGSSHARIRTSKRPAVIDPHAHGGPGSKRSRKKVGDCPRLSRFRKQSKQQRHHATRLPQAHRTPRQIEPWAKLLRRKHNLGPLSSLMELVQQCHRPPLRLLHQMDSGEKQSRGWHSLRPISSRIQMLQQSHRLIRRPRRAHEMLQLWLYTLIETNAKRPAEILWAA